MLATKATDTTMRGTILALDTNGVSGAIADNQERSAASAH